MKGEPQSVEDLRNSVRYSTNNIPINLISKDFYDIPARLNNVSLGGFQILCSHYAAQQLAKPKSSTDNQAPEGMNIIIEVLGNEDSKTFELSCRVAYIHQNHSPNDYCSDAVGLEALMDNPENRQTLNCFIDENTSISGSC